MRLSRDREQVPGYYIAYAISLSVTQDGQIIEPTGQTLVSKTPVQERLVRLLTTLDPAIQSL